MATYRMTTAANGIRYLLCRLTLILLLLLTTGSSCRAEALRLFREPLFSPAILAQAVNHFVASADYDSIASYGC